MIIVYVQGTRHTIPESTGFEIGQHGELIVYKETNHEIDLDYYDKTILIVLKDWSQVFNKHNVNLQF